MCLAISSSKEEGSLNYTILGNETAYHAMSAALDEADSAIFRAIFGPKSLGVSVVNHPLPFSSTEKIAKINTLANNILLIVCAGLALSVLSASFAVFLVKERTCGALQLHRLSGVGHGAYWFSNLFFDSLTACVPLAAIVLVFFAFEREIPSIPLDERHSSLSTPDENGDTVFAIDVEIISGNSVCIIITRIAAFGLVLLIECLEDHTKHVIGNIGETATSNIELIHERFYCVRFVLC